MWTRIFIFMIIQILSIVYQYLYFSDVHLTTLYTECGKSWLLSIFVFDAQRSTTMKKECTDNNDRWLYFHYE